MNNTEIEELSEILNHIKEMRDYIGYAVNEGDCIDDLSSVIIDLKNVLSELNDIEQDIKNEMKEINYSYENY